MSKQGEQKHMVDRGTGPELVAPELVVIDSNSETVPKMVWHRVTSQPEKVIIREKQLGIWRSITWSDIGDKTRQVAMALHALGLGKGDVTCVLSGNNPEWIYADLGSLCMGGVCAGIYPTDAEGQVEHQLNDSRTKVLFVEDEEQLDKALSVRENCPDLQKIVVFNMHGLRDFSDPDVLYFGDFLALGQTEDQKDTSVFSGLLERAGPDDLAILVYTSGTTGPPKGAMISHRNIIFQCANSAKTLDLREEDERLALLPMCHVAERVIGYYVSLWSGTISNYVENPETVSEDLREVQPTILGSVPRVWEKFYASTMMALADATPFQRWAWRQAMAVGYQVADLVMAGKPVPVLLGLKQKLAYYTVLKNVRLMMGLDRARYLWTGAAPISQELVRWYYALGLVMLEGFGQTENTGFATMNLPGKTRLGTVGQSVPYGEVSLSDEGEVLVRGQHVFMGYLNQPEKTQATIVDGWLHTGDVGEIDEDGFVTISDRMKDIIITAGGKNISPSEIEKELKFSLYISDAVVLGDNRKYLCSLIMIDQENVEKYAQDNDVPFTNFDSLIKAPEIVSLIESEIEVANKKFARVETIKQFRFLEKMLAPEDEELTPTMKLKRSFVSQKYADLIDSMYPDG
jgi:long-chain acyl-CoA synthetase